METKPVVVNKPTKVDPTAAADIARRTNWKPFKRCISNPIALNSCYDNGEVDGDTVSIVMNGEVIMPPLRSENHLYGGDSIKIVMYAETLGSLPPNSGPDRERWKRPLRIRFERRHGT